MDFARSFVNQPFKNHLILATVIRLTLISFAKFQDDNLEVPYTDVDYKVFSDAARHVFKGNSPYKRDTYRYSPIIAYLMIPNIYWKEFGKVLFCVFDALIAVAVKKLVERELRSHEKYIAIYCSLFWLYNPFSIAISTRGNADSVTCFFVILSLMFLQTDVVKSSIKYVYSGILLGVAIHLRLYPLAFSFPMYLSLERFEIGRVTFKEVLYYIIIPNKKQLLLAVSCVTTLVGLTYFMYFLYGYEFLYETYLYHFFRQDTKHNFSVLFYYSYLSLNQDSIHLVKTISQILEFIILFLMSLIFGCDPKTLPFGMFCQTVVLVAYNTVVTSQYFIWFLSLMPLFVHNLKMKLAGAVIWFMMWILSQVAWLFFAYLLEFHSRNVFVYIWMKGIVFFAMNIYILCELIKSFTPGFKFGMIADLKKK